MRIYWLWLATRPGMTEREKMVVLAHFGSPEDCYYADEFSGIENLSKNTLEALCDKDLGEAESISEACQRKKIHILTYGDDRYPRNLRNIIDPPLVLYYRGNLPDFDREPMIGVVGTRKASAYGLSTARQMGRQIAALEAEIGTPLFFREKYGVSLTPAGQRLFATAHSLLEQYNEILFDCRKAGRDQLPKLRIGTGPYEAILLREVLKELQARYGHRMEINLMGYTYKILTSRFRNESVHIGFCSERCGTSSGLLEFLPLYKENWKVMGSKSRRRESSL